MKSLAMLFPHQFKAAIRSADILPIHILLGFGLLELEFMTARSNLLALLIDSNN